ncbi:MAG: SDR family NAD(P)-dependent oxidoreductase [Hyphomicrobiales bacterium]
MTDLSSDIAIVTGASSGLGALFAETLADAGAHVICAARRMDRLEELAMKIQDKGQQATAIAFDAMDNEAADTLISKVIDKVGMPSILVNNAGLAHSGRAERMAQDDFDGLMQVNLKMPWLLSQTCARHWIENAPSNGRIVNIASILAHRVQTGVSAYCVSKAAILHMTKAHAREWARYGIHVNALSPGYFLTDINRSHWETDMGKAERERLPRRRIGEPKELAKTILYLTDPDNDYLNGSEIVLDDGQSLAI